jgi:hypothetical protein
VTLFTPEEREKVLREFTCSQKANRNQGLGENGPTRTIESDWFTEQNLDSSQSELTRNISTKSVILAPFNTTRSHQSEMHDSVKELVAEKRVVRLSAKVRDVDRQYEKNNNCELDNGVYNKFAYDTNSKDSQESQLNPLASNENSLDDQPPLHSTSPIPPPKHLPVVDASVQAALLKSLAPQPLLISTS